MPSMRPLSSMLASSMRTDLTVTPLSGDLGALLSGIGPPRKVAWNIILFLGGKYKKYILKDKKGGRDTARSQACFTEDYSLV